MRLVLACAALCMACAVDAPPAQAWGRDGHAIAAEIAQHYLTPAAAREVRQLLELENHVVLADVGSWADEVRRQRPWTARWHFVDIPVAAAGYDAARDCPGGACVVAKIEAFAHVFGDRKAAPRDRLEALKFVVHFVADAAQPLHCTERDGDRGGNRVRVTFLGRATNLHAVWDTRLIEEALAGEDPRRYADELVRRIDPAAAAAWEQGAPVDWADESHAVAKRVIYADLPETRSRLALSAAVARAWPPVVDAQLEKAGVRLAAVLNGALQ